MSFTVLAQFVLLNVAIAVLMNQLEALPMPNASPTLSLTLSLPPNDLIPTLSLTTHRDGHDVNPGVHARNPSNCPFSTCHVSKDT